MAFFTIFANGYGGFTGLNRFKKKFRIWKYIKSHKQKISVRLRPAFKSNMSVCWASTMTASCLVIPKINVNIHYSMNVILFHCHTKPYKTVWSQHHRQVGVLKVGRCDERTQSVLRRTGAHPPDRAHVRAGGCLSALLPFTLTV